MHTLNGINDRLDTHDGTVDNARPKREPDQAKVCLGSWGCPQQENTERSIDTNHHRLVLVLSRLPNPAGRLHFHQGVKRKKQECNCYKGYLQESPSTSFIHWSFSYCVSIKRPNINIRWKIFHLMKYYIRKWKQPRLRIFPLSEFKVNFWYIEMSTRIRYFQKRVIYNDLKFPDNYRYHHSPVPINFLLVQIPIRYLDNDWDWIM